jgi:hypothetical protein
MRSNMDKQTNIAAKRKAAELGPSSCLIHERRRTGILRSSPYQRSSKCATLSNAKATSKIVHIGDVPTLTSPLPCPRYRNGAAG